MNSEETYSVGNIIFKDAESRELFDTLTSGYSLENSQSKTFEIISSEGLVEILPIDEKEFIAREKYLAEAQHRKNIELKNRRDLQVQISKNARAEAERLIKGGFFVFDTAGRFNHPVLHIANEYATEPEHLIRARV